VPGRHRKMVRFYGAFLGPGDIGIDVGAHVGSRVRAWRALGARVIAVEPQPDFTRILRLFFGRDDGVTILPQALGARPGTARLGISTATPTVSSLSTDWIDTVATDRSFAKVRWDRSVEVPVTTLDALIKANPQFRSADGHLLYARCLEELGEHEAALKEYEVLARSYPGEEARFRYATLLKKHERFGDAQGVFQDMLKRARLAPRHYRRKEQEWLEAARRELAGLDPG